METLIVRGITNTRMRDFYDLNILLKLQGQNINSTFLKEALVATADKRNSTEVLKNGKEIIEEIFLDDILLSYWVRYQKKYSYADDISWVEVKEAVVSLWNMIE